MTTSLTFPNLFDVARNRVAISEDRAAIVNRVKLLLLTEPTELYNNPTYGVGLKKYMFQYNNDNTLALIKDRIITQLRIWEPCIDADKTVIERGNLFTGDSAAAEQDYNHLKLTIMMITIYGEEITIDLNNSDFLSYNTFG